eukprot:SAG11_NODE_22606_length_403_cov_0.674342_1_plen_81_part_00
MLRQLEPEREDAGPTPEMPEPDELESMHAAAVGPMGFGELNSVLAEQLAVLAQAKRAGGGEGSSDGGSGGDDDGWSEDDD